MSSGYTAIEPDEPFDDVSSLPSYATTDPSTARTAPTPQTYAQGPTQSQAPEPSSSAQQPQTLLERLKQSSHPIALFFYIFFRVSPVVVYIFGNIIIGQITSKNTFILHFIVLILLIAADFWNLKNISGRLLVGLRWWNETNMIDPSEGASSSGKDFENVWVFESADPNRYINPIDSKVFWLLLYGQPVAWILLAFLAFLKFQFLYMLLLVVAITLSMTNAMAFTKCDKFGKANNIANDIFSRATGSIFTRFNPFNR
ncbi:Golgi apparatus membrane protein TVP23 [Candida viswanathii]|uniref:Golgi apparatus membrane protein TVP23 n=1 Tax=Candida viswanathii TaxID=5486 RepID=A0A367YFG9_9ASCO|nr:Golgi apparatus membrane protein TVP23 [Candida viswanathii]